MDLISLAIEATKNAINAPFSATAYRPPERSYERATAALSNATFNTRDLCKLKYEGDPYVNALLQKAIQIEHTILKAMIIERFDVLVEEALRSVETSDRGTV
ncbi:hypothetical protein [Sulfitobacter sp.]|uniref:hypothetical protein n=1 Tax=Sulfitobacter sp. TaxID=1903071 RepID=UPI0030014616